MSTALVSGNAICLLYGLVHQDSVAKLVDRLVGLCGDLEFDSSRLYVEHSIAFIPANETPFGSSRNDDVVLRLKAPILNESGKLVPLAERRWKLCQELPPEPPKRRQEGRTKIAPHHRVVYETEITGDPFRFLQSLGYEFCHEYVRRGYSFVYEHKLITITKVYEPAEKYKVSTAALIDPDSVFWMVELTSPRVNQESVPLAMDEVTKLSSHLQG
ncbi:uncharacterized protein BJ171DRAFT_520023 [Polychytrium aggregatum]|uniref:uncharacterized protein n=1 Tax=Polychytrium aggregatum TaxID=110093 RepID=UPI0022FF434C|nr:uncharacterized protein BJ171DRAFT_520023 [Polychytrium aggregatum]KAI9197364.1 hypothetical protein BJ171DRAFT_520023 [Polychytrium aggregatum]